MSESQRTGMSKWWLLLIIPVTAAASIGIGWGSHALFTSPVEPRANAPAPTATQYTQTAPQQAPMQVQAPVQQQQAPMQVQAPVQQKTPTLAPAQSKGPLPTKSVKPVVEDLPIPAPDASSNKTTVITEGEDKVSQATEEAETPIVLASTTTVTAVNVEAPQAKEAVPVQDVAPSLPLECRSVDGTTFRNDIASLPWAVVKFQATWCGACKGAAKTAFEQYGREAPAFTVDVDRSPDLHQQFGGGSIPKYVVFHRGQPVWKMTGALQSTQAVRNFRAGAERHVEQNKVALQ